MGLPMLAKGGAPKPPTPPDPSVTIPAQTKSNIDTASATSSLNAVNQVSPFGTVSYDKIGEDMVGGNAVPRWQQTVAYSPGQQKLYDSQMGLEQQALDVGGRAIGNVNDTISKPFSLDGLPQLASNIQGPNVRSGYQSYGPAFGIPYSGEVQSDIGPYGSPQTGFDYNRNIPSDIDMSGLPGLPQVSEGERRRIEGAYMARGREDIGRRREDERSRLQAQGLNIGSEGYNEGLKPLEYAENDLFGQAVRFAGDEESRLMRDALASRSQQFGERHAQGVFGLGAQQQGYQQARGEGEFGNQALAQQFAQLLSSGQFGRESQMQRFGQNAAGQQAYNQAAGQATGQNAGAAGFENASGAQSFDQLMRSAAMQNQTRQQGLTEEQVKRNQYLNELAALLSSSQIQMPTGAPNFGIGAGGTDVLGAYGLQQQGQMNAYNAQMAERNAMWGAFGNMAGMAGSAYLMRPPAPVPM